MSDHSDPQIIIARTAAAAVLAKAYASPEPALVSVVGRRRIGKTFLVRRTFAAELVFHVTGIARANRTTQLANFRVQVEVTFGASPTSEDWTTWLSAFSNLARRLDVALARDPARRVVFLDELPWLASARSGFLDGFAWFWNSWAYDHRVVVVICGSAASWMIRRVVNDKGSLHNRITHRITLQPFDLAETFAYLDARNIVAEPYQRLQLYMAFGGVPFYLSQLEPGRSAIEEVQRLLFDAHAPLLNEFDLLYRALFDQPERHLAVVEYLAAHPGGITRERLRQATGTPDGGALTRVLGELELSGFVEYSPPFGKRSKTALYRLIDEFSAFYLKFVADVRPTENLFFEIAGSPSYRSWSGFAFERVCLRNVAAIKRALGIGGIVAHGNSFQATATEAADGVQIDLLLDRSDRTITLVEIKWADDEYVLTKVYADQLREKIRRFKRHTRTRKQVFLVLVTPFGMRLSPHAPGLIDRVLTLEDLVKG